MPTTILLKAFNYSSDDLLKMYYPVEEIRLVKGKLFRKLDAEIHQGLRCSAEVMEKGSKEPLVREGAKLTKGLIAKLLRIRQEAAGLLQIRLQILGVIGERVQVLTLQGRRAGVAAHVRADRRRIRAIHRNLLLYGGESQLQIEVRRSRSERDADWPGQNQVRRSGLHRVIPGAQPVDQVNAVGAGLGGAVSTRTRDCNFHTGNHSAGFVSHHTAQRCRLTVESEGGRKGQPENSQHAQSPIATNDLGLRLMVTCSHSFAPTPGFCAPPGGV